MKLMMLKISKIQFLEGAATTYQGEIICEPLPSSLRTLAVPGLFVTVLIRNFPQEFHGGFGNIVCLIYLLQTNTRARKEKRLLSQDFFLVLFFTGRRLERALLSKNSPGISLITSFSHP